MVITVFIWLAILGIVYYHYLQGFFSATLSALVAVVAALLAVGWHENLTNLVNRGALSDQAYAITLVGIFVLVYSLLRYGFDKLVPGNVRFFPLLDKIGAAAMGLVAGIAGTGVVMIAAQSLPLHPSIGMYCRYPVNETIVNLPQKQGQSQMGSATIDILDDKKLISNETSSEVMPYVDDILMGAVYYLSDDTGALCGNSMRAVHPDYLQELFAQRVGIQPAAKRTAMPEWVHLEKDPQGTAAGVYMATPEWVVDVEGTDVRPPKVRQWGGGTPEYLPELYGKQVLVVRVYFDPHAAEPVDGVVRLSPASVRLVGRDGDNPVNLFCEGLLDPKGKILYSLHPDDPIGVDKPGENGDRFVDLVFGQRANLYSREAAGGREMLPGTFLEIKRLARIPLSKSQIAPFKPDPDKYGLLLKKDMDDLLKSPPAPATAAALTGTWQGDFAGGHAKAVFTANSLSMTVGASQAAGDSKAVVRTGPWRVLSTDGYTLHAQWAATGPEGQATVQADVVFGWYKHVTFKEPNKDPVVLSRTNP